MDVRGRALVLTLVSSGMRLNEALSLTENDIDFESNPVKITIRGTNTKTKQTRFTFITPEAAQCVKAWLKKRDEYIALAATRNKGVIEKGRSAPKDTTSDKVFPFSDNAVNSMWETALKAAGLFSQDTQTGRNQLRIHSFRAFFITQLSMAGQKVLAESLAGHMGYLDGAYRQIPVEQAAPVYLNIMHVVTIGTPTEFKERVAAQDNRLKIQGESIEGLRAINDRLQRQFDLQQQQIETLEKTIKNMETGLQKVTELWQQEHHARVLAEFAPPVPIELAERKNQK